MGLKVYKPTSPGRRGMTSATFEEITKKKPEKALLVPLKRTGGRNNQGRITVRHRGGGTKRMLRIIDFKRNKIDVIGEVVAIEYDPCRSARIALINYDDGERRYILAPLGLVVGSSIISSDHADPKTGNTVPIGHMPVGTQVHNIELYPGRGGQVVRSAGAAAQILGKEDGYTLVRMPSEEVRKFSSACRATVGQVGNLDHENITIGKAGRNRWKGRRPTVRGSAMTPRDHPHGGGEGRSPCGMNPKTPWGKPARGVPTRRNKVGDKMIVRRRRK